MNNDEFEKRMRALEQFHSLRLPPGVWTVLRVDGRSFTRFTETGFEKPIDIRFQQMMRQTAQEVLFFDKYASLQWISGGLGIDGVIITAMKQHMIQGEGEWDPPGGWKPFALFLDSGHKVISDLDPI